MGCDIHHFVEIKNKAIKGVWLDATLYSRNPFFDLGDEEPEFITTRTPCSKRNYELFSLIADVRNYNDNFCLSEPKGLPEDISSHIQSHFDEAPEDYHSASYFTLKELEDFYNQEKDNFFKNAVLDIDKKHELILPLITELKFIADSHFIRDTEDIRIVFWFDN